MNYIIHCFMPGHTLEGIIKKVVRHDLPKSEVLKYVALFNQLNGCPVIKPGISYKIPTSLTFTDGEGSDTD
jgi:hypothetical protein